MTADRFICLCCGWPQTAQAREGCLETALAHFVHTGHDVKAVELRGGPVDRR
jgi:hypothetical protein